MAKNRQEYESSYGKGCGPLSLPGFEPGWRLGWGEKKKIRIIYYVKFISYSKSIATLELERKGLKWFDPKDQLT